MRRTVAVAIIVSLAISAGAIYLYDRHFAPRIVVLDLNGYIEKQNVQFTGNRIDAQKLRARFKAARGKIEELSRDSIILSKEAVIAGGKDISSELESADK